MSKKSQNEFEDFIDFELDVDTTVTKKTRPKAVVEDLAEELESLDTPASSVKTEVPAAKPEAPAARKKVVIEDLNTIQEPKVEELFDEDAMAEHISRNLSQASEHSLEMYKEEKKAPEVRDPEPDEYEDEEEEPARPAKRGFFGRKRRKEEEYVDDDYEDDDYDDDDEYEDEYDDDEYEDDEEDEPLTLGAKIRLAILGLLGVAIVAVCGLAVVYLMQNQQKINYYRSHFLPATTINGIDCSEMTVDEVYKAFEAVVENFELHVVGVNGDFVLTNDEADMKMSIDIDFNDILDQQDHSAYKVAADNPQNLTITAAVSVDEDNLRKLVEQEAIFQNMTESHSCTVTYNETTNSFDLGESVHGTHVNILDVEKRVIECFKILKSELDLESEGYYGKIVDINDAVKSSVSMMNQCLKASVVLDFEEAGSETMDPAILRECLKTDDDMLLAFDTAPLAKWVASVADIHDTAGKKHQFHTTSGRDIEVSGGTYGWKINQDATVQAIAGTIQAGQAFNQAPDYSQIAMNHVGVDVGTTYIEVDLTNQILYYYKNGVLSIQTNIISGDVKGGNITPNGVFSVYAKETNKSIKNDNDSTAHDVAYWMPFYGNYGIQDASWRSSFGGSIYVTNGSNGSIYVSSNAAEQIFQAIGDNVPVVIYGGQSTYTPPSTERQTTAGTIAPRPTDPVERPTTPPTSYYDPDDPTEGTEPGGDDPTEGTEPGGDDPTEGTEPGGGDNPVDPPETDPPTPPPTDPPAPLDPPSPPEGGGEEAQQVAEQSLE